MVKNFMIPRVLCWTLLCLLTWLPTAMAQPIRIDDFDLKSHQIDGKGWSVVKYAREQEGLTIWGARFEVKGEDLHDLIGGATNPDWVGFLTWPPASENPAYLMVTWNDGGNHSPNELRVIALRDHYPLVFSTDGASFDYIEDLDGDSQPEIVAYSLAFQGFYYSAIDFSMVESPMPRLIATYDSKRGRFMWANALFPEKQKEWLENYQKAFLKDWPDAEKRIPVSIAVGQFLEEALAYRSLMHWAVNASYAAGEQAANAIIDQYTDPVLAVFTKHSLRMTLRQDRNYNLMMNNPVER